MYGEGLEVPQFIPSFHKSFKQFGFSFAYGTRNSLKKKL